MKKIKVGSKDGFDDAKSTAYQNSIIRVTLFKENGLEYEDILADELPLSVTLQGQPYATFMRTPGDDEELILGFLMTEGIITDLDDVETIVPCHQKPDQRIHVLFASGISVEPSRHRAFISSSCGLCSLEEYVIDNHSILDQGDTHRLHQSLTKAQVLCLLDHFNRLESLYSITGGAHAAAIFNQKGDLLVTATDVGRHNAVDKVIGYALKSNNTQFSEYTLMVSSRAGYEIVLKAVKCGIGTLVTLGAASGGAHRLARARNLALFSFARPQRVHRHQK